MDFGLVAVPLAYLLGSLSGSVILGRMIGVDIRQHGSGNAGATNAFRTLGVRFALGVVSIDVAKGALAAVLGRALTPPEWLVWACIVAACVGHTWPLFHGFRGGKGAATMVGGLLVTWPVALLPLFGLWVLLLGLTGYVGPATVCAAWLLPLFSWIWRPDEVEVLIFALVVAVFITFTHRGNLQRLLRGEEHRFERARVLQRWRRQ